MSDKERERADRIFGAVVSLEMARTVLKVTMEYFRLDETNLQKEDRQIIGLQVGEIGTMLLIVNDYMFRAIDALNRKEGGR